MLGPFRRPPCGLLSILLASAILTLALASTGARAQDFVAPQLVAPLELEYPSEAAAERPVDSVELMLYIDATGALVRVDLLSPPLRPELGFEEAAREALARATFSPATLDGAPVPTKLPITLDFYPPRPHVSRLYRAAKLDANTPPWTSRLYREAREAFSRRNRSQLAGQLLERGTRTPLPGVLISVESPSAGLREVYTDADGRFELTSLPEGDYTLRIDEEAFGAYETREVVGEAERVEVTYHLERALYDAYGVDSDLVYETRESALRKDVTRRTLAVSEIQKIPGEGGDALKVVQNLPGVARSTFNSGQIIVRGSAPEDTLVFLDGVTIPQLYHFAGLTSVINSDVLSRIDFIPGNFSVQYGRAMGGVLDVRTRPPASDRVQGYVDIDVVDTAILVEGPLTDDLSFQVSARRSYFDTLLELVLPADAGVDPTAAPRYWDYQARLRWEAGDGHTVEGMLYGSDDALTVAFEEPNPSRVFRSSLTSSIAFHKAQLRWDWEGEDGVLSNALVFNTGWRGFSFSIGEVGFAIDAFQNALRDTFTIRPLSWLAINTGVDITADVFAFDLKLPRERQVGEPRGALFTREFVTVSADDADLQPAAFLELELTPLEALLITVGGRVDATTLTEDVAVDVRGSARYAVLGDALTLKAGVGTFHQPPRYDDLGPGILDRRFGSENLGYERALHVTGGVESVLPFYEPLSLELNGFYKELDNLIEESERIVERDGALAVEGLANIGRGEVVGMELLLRHNLANGFFGWIAYTLSRAQRTEFNEGQGGDLYPFDFDQTHILTLVGSVQLPDHWQVGLRFRYVTGRPFTPNIDGVFDADADDYEDVEGPVNSVRVEDFHQLDLRVDKSFIFESWILAVYLDIQNVYYHANAEAIDYNYDYTQRGFVRGLPILPSFGVRGSF